MAPANDNRRKAFGRRLRFISKMVWMSMERDF